jgi:hypothetical protein
MVLTMMSRMAFCDESMRIRPGPDGVYVLSAAIFEATQLDDARDVLRSVAPRAGRFHWRDETPASRRKAVEALAAIPSLHTVVVATSMDSQKQERARALCMERLLWVLEQDGIVQVAFENRTMSLNRADLNTLNQLRARRVISPGGLRISHVKPSTEPLLWAADIIAGACREVHDGRTECRMVLDDVIIEHLIDASR